MGRWIHLHGLYSDNYQGKSGNPCCEINWLILRVDFVQIAFLSFFCTLAGAANQSSYAVKSNLQYNLTAGSFCSITSSTISPVTSLARLGDEFLH